MFLEKPFWWSIRLTCNYEIIADSYIIGYTWSRHFIRQNHRKSVAADGRLSALRINQCIISIYYVFLSFWLRTMVASWYNNMNIRNLSIPNMYIFHIAVTLYTKTYYSLSLVLPFVFEHVQAESDNDSWWRYCMSKINKCQFQLGIILLRFTINLSYNKYYFCFLYIRGPPWSWSFDSCIYNFLCNQCLSQLKLWVRIPLMVRCSAQNLVW